MYTAYGIVTLYEWPWWSCNTLVERFSLNQCIARPPRPFIESDDIT